MERDNSAKHAVEGAADLEEECGEGSAWDAVGCRPVNVGDQQVLETRRVGNRRIHPVTRMEQFP